MIMTRKKPEEILDRLQDARWENNGLLLKETAKKLGFRPQRYVPESRTELISHRQQLSS